MELALIVEAAQAGQRLDRLLSDALPDRSRGAVQKAVEAGCCLVDGLPVTTPSRKLKAGQEIRFSPPDVASSLEAEEGEVDILWHDENLLVCSKPAGLTVHPCPSCPSGTLVQRLLRRFPQLASQEGLRPGIVHRLDKDTSGLLLAALDEKTRLALSEAFARREVRKRYLALARGVPAARGVCREPIGRHPTAKIKMAVVPEARGGKPAHSEWERLWSSPDNAFSLLAIRIHTGRTHQIRVHMAHEGHPLLGDALYAPAETARMAPRQMLHAWRLQFRHPLTGKEMRFCCPPPRDFIDAAVNNARRMQRVVLTGNPGSGKSAAAAALRNRGIPVISADEVVTGLYAPGGEAADLLARRWGGDLLDARGGVDKDALLALFHRRPEARREVEELIHALVRDAVERFWNAEEARGVACAAAEIPLYYECGWHNGAFSPRPVVAAIRTPREQRFSRLRDNRGWDEEKSALIESWQWPAERKEAAADLTLDNSGDLAALERAVADLDGRLARRRAEDDAELERIIVAACGCDDKEDENA